MSEPYRIGLIGYGRINRDIAERVQAADDTELGYVYVRSEKEGIPTDIQISTPEEIADHPVDLSVEAATPAVLADLAEPILAESDLLVLSGSAVADPEGGGGAAGGGGRPPPTT
jgi:predicted dinucleotide-utilizing enzyme